MDEAEIRKNVRKGYGEIARKSQEGKTPVTPSCCGETGVSTTQSCCGPATAGHETTSCGCGDATLEYSESIGYSTGEIGGIPDGANLGLGCGNPVALASLKEGETVLDLGSGAGIDCFLAANRVGKSGSVIGVDMTADMLDRARENASKGNYENVEFRLGEIENLPVADNTVDVIISNCVINLSPDKARVFNEAFRVLKPGGRLMVSDIVLLKELPDAVKNSIEAYVGCVAGANLKQVYIDTIKKAGFSKVDIVGETSFTGDAITESPSIKAGIERHNLDSEKVYDLTSSIASIKVQAIKPA